MSMKFLLFHCCTQAQRENLSITPFARNGVLNDGVLWLAGGDRCAGGAVRGGEQDGRV